jgi:hypothetical protein
MLNIKHWKGISIIKVYVVLFFNMKTVKVGIFSAALTVILVVGSSCHTDNRGFFHRIQTDQYYHAEIFRDGYKDVYGDWVLKAISGGTTIDGFIPDFERIVIQKIGIYKMFRNDSLLSYGKINIMEDDKHALKISFKPDRGLKNISFYGTEKYLYLREGHLNLFASCCNQHNYHFARMK